MTPESTQITLSEEDVERIAKRVFVLVMRRLARAAALPEDKKSDLRGESPTCDSDKGRVRPTPADFAEVRARRMRRGR